MGRTTAKRDRRAAKKRARDADRPAPTVEPPTVDLDHIKKSKYAKWRALSLSLVYLVFALHILHWKITGQSLAPLELNEVMYTLEAGIITAGFLFMCLLVLGTLIFGRFFCSWACHIMVLQDLCAWILRKLRIRQKPIRSRLLLWVPPLTACYMFIWPQIKRANEARAFPEFHFRTDTEGWASFVTADFWRNLPTAPIIILTFLVCGFAIVYLLGSRTFCTYICPYGSIFGLADRFSPARILVNDSCAQCGTCTAACTSGVRVHEEVKEHGMIVNPACMKDLDCVGHCPQNALHYGFSKPALFRSYGSGGRFGLPYQFSLGEELLMSFVFVAALLSFRGLYGKIPFLLSLAIGAIVGFFCVAAVRLATRSNVNIANMRLKAAGRLTAVGAAFSVIFAVLALLVGHSAFIRYNEYNGLRKAEALGALMPGDDAAPALAQAAFTQLSRAQRWGLFTNYRVHEGLAYAAMHLARWEDLERHASAFLARYPSRYPDSTSMLLRLGQAHAAEGRIDKAARAFQDAVALTPTHRATYQQLGGVLTELAADGNAAEALRRAAILEPRSSAKYQALAWVQAMRGERHEAADSLIQAVEMAPENASLLAELGGRLASLGAVTAAIDTQQRAVRIDGTSAVAHYGLGMALLTAERLAEAIEELRASLHLDPDFADAHYNLSVALGMSGRLDEAIEEIAVALRLKPGDEQSQAFQAHLMSLTAGRGGAPAGTATGTAP